MDGWLHPPSYPVNQNQSNLINQSIIDATQVEYDADCGGLDREAARGVLTPGALTFVAELVHEFRDGVAEVGG